MKLSGFLFFSGAAAFSVRQSASNRLHGGGSSATQLLAVSRRDAIISVAIGAAVGLAPARSNADIDYSKVQDLLRRPDGSEASPQTFSPSGRPMYLKEPTEEFKRNEAKAADFRRAQLQRKQTFAALLDKLDTDPNDQDLLARDLDEIRRFIGGNGGLPQGITKEELVKRIRRRKDRRYGPVKVEIAYQHLLQEVRQQQSANSKDEENPL